MKKIYLLLILLIGFAGNIHAQPAGSPVFYLNKLTTQDILLSGWVFKAGDNPAWANPAFDDRTWRAADPGADVTHFEVLKKAGTGWLRLHIKADSSVLTKTLSAWVYQFTASEIYLDGKLLKRYGTIGAGNTKAISPGHELFVLPLQKGREQVIAVRLGYQPGIPYVAPNFIPMPAFSLYVNDYPAASANYVAYQDSVKHLIITYMLFLGIFVFITIIHLAYYIYDRKQKVHLYYFIFSFFISLACAVSIPFFNNMADVVIQVSLDVVCCFSNVMGDIFAVLVLYLLFDYASRIYLKILALAGIASFAFVFAGGSVGFMCCVSLFPILAMVEGVRVSIWALLRKKRGAVVLLPFIILCIVLNAWSALTDQTSLLSQIVGGLSFICLPVGMAFYLGIQNSLQNRRLAESLVEVRLLSDQKQQILADQNVLLEQQVSERTAELHQSLTDLKQTQNQLIQSAKMASLGELTAGIAHEIQNPLNFVNNFSEVNREMISELKEEIKGGNPEEALAIADDIAQNEEKINHHGKRADAIVKGMLQHSQTNPGQKAQVDISALVDEYLRLAYRSFTAKDKSFQVELITQFDRALPPAMVTAQDIGRVMLNLFNNAFYAVKQKQKTAGVNYNAEVWVTTSSRDNEVVIKVKDNGIGIPDAIKDKIMQPFFTTKPTGEGTGLGLSLTYDMIVKGHGGKIEVNTKAGEFAEFILLLPLR